MTATLGLSMIVRDAEGTLAACLESARGIVDEIVIGDTGSVDATVAVAERLGARVLKLPWENDFSSARNRVLGENRADWILSLDADELLDAHAAEAIPKLIGSDRLAGYQVTIWNYVLSLNNRLWDRPARPNPGCVPAAAQYPAYVEHQNVRLFRRHPEIYFEGKVHETTGHRILGTGRPLGEADFVIHHFGLALDSEARLRKARIYRDLGRAKVEADPGNAQAHFELGIEELDTFHEPARALESFERVIELNPKAHRAWLFAGVALVRLERFQQGLERLKRAERLGGATALMLETEGDAYYRLGDFARALRSYRKACRAGTRSALLESKIGVAEVRTGCPREGLRRMAGAIDRDPAFAELYDMLTIAAVWAGDLKLAADTAERRLTAGDPTPEGYLKVASIRARAGEWDRARAVLAKGLDRFPSAAPLIKASSEVDHHDAAASSPVLS